MRHQSPTFILTAVLSIAFSGAAFSALTTACGGSSDNSAESDDDLTRRKKDAGAKDSGSSVDSGPAPDFQACDQQHTGANSDGDNVTFCDRPFASAPAIRLPADDKSSDNATVYVAYNLAVGNMVTRDGTTLAFMDANGKYIAFQDHGASMPSSFHMPSNRNMYLVYRVTGKLGTVSDPAVGDNAPAIHVTGGQPVVQIPGKVLDGTMQTTWEGTTNARMPDGRFSSDQVPIRVTFTSMEATNNLKIWQTGSSLPDGPVFRVIGTIENYAKSVTGSDGTCYASLTSLGDKNPFHGATKGNVDMYRMGGMHFPGDQVLVFTVPQGTSDWSLTAMGGLGPFGPTDWISTSGWSELDLFPHGLPKGNEIKLHVATGSGGGDGC